MDTLSHSVPLAEAKNKLSELVDRVAHGEEFIITRHDREIARLAPVSRRSRKDVADAIRDMRANRKNRQASIAEILEWKGVGRR
jgi:prevent-host-death family protein